MAIKRGLGKSFAALIPTDVIESEFDITASTDEQVSELRQIKVDDIVRDDDQPRKDFDEAALGELADSIREHGVITPIIVVASGDKFQIVAGERRWRASKMAGRETVPALVRTLSGQHKLELSLIENAQREDLKPLEFSTALLKMREQFNMSQEEISKKIGKSVSVISNYLRLMSLPDFAKQAVADGYLTEGHARQVLALNGDAAAQKTLVDGIVEHGWSVRKSEEFVIGYKRGKREGKTDGGARAVQAKTDLTEALGKRIGLSVRQKMLGHGAGQIIITFKSERELAELKKLLDC
ncbi:MAG: ParB/RepB/Spo0J family partition protein [Candidatus Nomurabacteria bacterium]|jgi:ParB family chromosome partitioning protein|nr:ParB/RepB/Spo0J family partition protein [Candidatus Nomurabacteria bacterium]